MQHVCGNGDGTSLPHFGRSAFNDFTLEIRPLLLDRVPFRAQQNVSQNRNCVAAFDNARDMTQRAQQFTSLDHNLHRVTPLGDGRSESAVLAKRRERPCGSSRNDEQ